MNEYTAAIVEAEKLMRKEEYSSAREILHQLENEIPADGRIQFSLGNVSLRENDFSRAHEFYENALQYGYTDYRLFYSLAVAKEKMGSVEAAEEYYCKAIKSADETKKPPVLNAVFLFYIRTKKYEKAKNLATAFIEYEPDSYTGYHLYECACIYAESYQEGEHFLREHMERFQGEASFWVDFLALLELQHKYEEIISMIDTKNEIMETIPELALREKLKCTLKRDDHESAAAIISELYDKFPRDDVAISAMLTAMADGKYLEAGNIANKILQRDKKNPGDTFFFAMYLDAFIIYLIADRTMPAEMADSMVDGLKICKAWFSRRNIPVDGVDELISIIEQAGKT